jgi:hypothetical protein
MKTATAFGALALAFASLSTAASGATVTVTYDQLSGQALSDILTTEPSFASGSSLGPDGLPKPANGFLFVDINSHGEALWWSGAPLSNPPTPTVTSTPEDVAVNAFPACSAPAGNYAVEAIATFTSAVSATETLDVSGNGLILLYLNGALILSHPNTGASFTSAIGENLVAGTNVITSFYIDAGNAPAFSFDPSLPPSPVAPTPELSTCALLALGVAGLAFAGRRQLRRKAVLA